MNFKPLHDRVAIKPDVEQDKTTGGIIIPDTAKDKPMRGTVVAVGNGTKDQNGNIIPLEVKEGNSVIYGKWGGTEVKVGGDDLIIMKESDIIGIISK